MCTDRYEGDGRVAEKFSSAQLSKVAHEDLDEFDELDDAAGKLGPVLRRAMARNRVTGLHHTGQWVDVGTPERLQSLDQWLHERARTS